VTEIRSEEPFLRVTPSEAKAVIEKGIPVVDVREPQEYAVVRIPGATLVPLGTLLRSPRDYLQHRAILFICSEGIRSAVACEAAAAVGLEEIYNLEGGTERWQAEGHPVESGAGSDRAATPARAAAAAFPGEFLQTGERLIHVHRFRFARPAGCTLGTLDLTVDESLGEAQDPSRRCVARPEHPTRVVKPEFTVFAESVEAAVRALIEKLRGRRPPDIFFPTE
jgi:rhodanese-related sulfurtransferase